MEAEAAKVFEHKKFPAVGGLIVKALQTRDRKPDEETRPPDWRVTVAGVKADRELLARYREVCGFPTDGHLPILYPQVMAVSLHMDLMTRDGFPFPMMGLIHMANVFEQKRQIGVDETFNIQVRIDGVRPSRFGTEFDIVTELVDQAGEIPWKSTCSVLQRIERKKPVPPVRPQQTMPAIGRKLAQYNVIEAPENIGRRYARASQEYNPIHLTHRTARYLGLPHMLAHGMWTAARCCALLPEPENGWKRYEVRFRNALFLPSRTVQRYYRAETAAGPVGYDFALVNADGSVLLDGWLR